MSEDLKSVQGKISVTKSAYNKETDSEEIIEVTPFHTTPATVSVKAGVTVNLGDFEFGRADIMISVPCYIEEIDEVFIKVKDKVDDLMAIEYKELKKAAKGK